MASPVRVLYVGRLERYKGLYVLLEAMRDIANAALTVVGDGSYRRQLKSLRRGCGYSLRGFNRTLTGITRDGHFVMPSLGPEGFGIVTMEAMAHGLPCLISDLGRTQRNNRNRHGGDAFSQWRRGRPQAKVTLLIEETQLRTGYSSGRLSQSGGSVYAGYRFKILSLRVWPLMNRALGSQLGRSYSHETCQEIE